MNIGRKGQHVLPTLRWGDPTSELHGTFRRREAIANRKVTRGLREASSAVRIRVRSVEPQSGFSTIRRDA
jgi:hypothetical protein